MSIKPLNKMKKIALLTFAALTISLISLGQETDNKTQSRTDSVEMRKVFGGYQFYHEGKQLKIKQLEELLKPNELAYRQIRSSRSSRTISAILGYAGGFMIGWPLGTAIAGGKPNWVLAGAGAGLAAISIPIGASANKKMKNAVSIYNSAQ